VGLEGGGEALLRYDQGWQVVARDPIDCAAAPIPASECDYLRERWRGQIR
jgi:hypothetical protein